MIKILVVDRHAIFREGLCSVFTHEEDMEFLAGAKDGKEAVSLAKRLRPDLVIIDVDLPEMDGIESGEIIKSDNPKTSVVIMTHRVEESFIASTIRAGLDGYLIKDITVEDLKNSIRTVYSGEGVFNLKATRHVLRSALTDSTVINHCDLHEREMEILRLITSGMSNKQIGAELNISTHTVASHIVNIFRKLGVESRGAAMLHALKEGWVSLNNLPAPNSGTSC